MALEQTTPIPNDFFDAIPHLTHAELRVLLVVFRQTYGWIDRKTGNRKLKDRLTYNYIISKTGLYRTILSETIQSLVDKKMLVITNIQGTTLDTPQSRSGKRYLFFQYQPVRNFDVTYSQSRIVPIRIYEQNKRNTIKRKSIQKQTARQVNNLNQLKNIVHQLSDEKRIVIS